MNPTVAKHNSQAQKQIARFMVRNVTVDTRRKLKTQAAAVGLTLAKYLAHLVDTADDARESKH